MIDFSHLESPLEPIPAFPVQAPDGRNDWSEIDRQGTFLTAMRNSAPRVLVYPNANAGKRNPRTARREGIRAGVFDLTCIWKRETVAWIELKGYSKAGRPGSLSPQQIEFGNRLVDLGRPCACFFNPYDAVEWLREQGFPVSEVRRAA